MIETLYQTLNHKKWIFQRKELKTQYNETLKFEANNHIVENTSNKNTTTKHAKKIELKKKSVKHAYQQDEFKFNKKLNSRPIREKKREERVLKYFDVENDVCLLWN